ncbi:MAG: hypothetical protein ACOVNY_01670 [Chitinophagaceae bacterium]
MYSHTETVFNTGLSLVAACDVVEQKYHAGIQKSCVVISEFLSENSDALVQVSQNAALIELLFNKLKDELTHLILKESGILFTCIRKKCRNATKNNCSCLDSKVVESIFKTHQIIINITQKLRFLLNNYHVIGNTTSKWNDCVNEFFQLENMILQWIHVEQNFLYPTITFHQDISSQLNGRSNG